MRARAHREPAHIHRVGAGGSSRGVTAPVSRVYLPVSLTVPGPSGGAGPSRLRRGCSHPPRRLTDQAASSFTPLLRQQGGEGLSPPPRPAAPRGAALVKPRLADPQRPAAHRVQDAVPLPLGRDQGSHGYRPIASCTQRATLRLRTSHLMASSAFSLRSRASSARSSSLIAPVPPPRRLRSSFTQLPKVPSLIPSSRATCAIGLPVSRTSRTAPSLKSRSNFLRVSPTGALLSLKRTSPRYEGKRKGSGPAGWRRRTAAGTCGWRRQAAGRRWPRRVPVSPASASQGAGLNPGVDADRAGSGADHGSAVPGQSGKRGLSDRRARAE